MHDRCNKRYKMVDTSRFWPSVQCITVRQRKICHLKNTFYTGQNMSEENTFGINPLVTS
jgi:hypothetical protein